MRTPLVLLGGVDPTAMATTMVGLQFSLPGAVSLRHHIDVEGQVLTRTVSDFGGVVEEHRIDLDHACVSCAIREDIVPTLERLARDGRWDAIVAHLPTSAEPSHLCAALTWDTRLARFLRVSAVVTALAAADPVRDLLEDDLLCERGVHTAYDDRRGVGEVLASMIEYSDVVTFDGPPTPEASALVRTLARPDVLVVDEASDLGADDLSGRRHRHVRTDAWIAGARPEPLPAVAGEGVWRLDLRSERPFHPERLLDELERLGTGRHRSRGCFFLPTRPDRVVEWDGAGGQLSIGGVEGWGGRRPFTRLVFIGVGSEPVGLRDAFEELLLRPDEPLGGWNFAEDGFEPWLGPIKEVA